MIKQSPLKKNVDEILKVLKNDPYEQSQSFEKLLPKSEGRYSRRLNHQHRVVYIIDEEHKIVTLYSAWSHYE